MHEPLSDRDRDLHSDLDRDRHPDPFRLATLDALRTVYRQPSQVVIDKERTAIDPATQQFLERCRFAVVGTFDADGNPDTSPRGGDSGFVRVLDQHHIAVADLGGNNRLDTLQNIVASGRVAFVFVMPGKSETVRVNGDAWITTDPDVLARFELPRTPKTAIVCAIQTTYVHCAKAFHRSGMWDPTVWSELADAPDGADILSCQLDAQFTPQDLRGFLDEDYDAALAFERSSETVGETAD
ncbi:MAG: pyridoxamine 5'-phosphate oxidase family protein [Actinobacteria bacterium]|nr:pyridoxamine 5'-phosphate oxidase family protein [Actinomycetota bacterium]